MSASSAVNEHLTHSLHLVAEGQVQGQHLNFWKTTAAGLSGACVLPEQADKLHRGVIDCEAVQLDGSQLMAASLQSAWAAADLLLTGE